ncbi:unnamed protein product, partial [marine sediment metagenome]
GEDLLRSLEWIQAYYGEKLNNVPGQNAEGTNLTPGVPLSFSRSYTIDHPGKTPRF